MATDQSQPAVATEAVLIPRPHNEVSVSIEAIVSQLPAPQPQQLRGLKVVPLPPSYPPSLLLPMSAGIAVGQLPNQYPSLALDSSPTASIPANHYAIQPPQGYTNQPLNIYWQQLQPPVGTPLPATSLPAPKQDFTRSHSKVDFVCPHCSYRGQTEVRYEAGDCTYIAMAMLCCLFCPTTCCPLCSKCCKDAFHYCPHCLNNLGKHKACS